MGLTLTYLRYVSNSLGMLVQRRDVGVSSFLWPMILYLKISAAHTPLFGMPHISKTDEFSEKFRTAFEPPPLIFGKSCCGFVPKFMTEVPFIMAKICNINFWNENDLPPSFGTFPKIHPFWYGKSSLRDAPGYHFVCFFEHCSNGLCPPPPSFWTFMLRIFLKVYWKGA